MLSRSWTRERLLNQSRVGVLSSQTGSAAMILFLKFCVFLFCIAASPSQADRCEADEECRDIKTCDEKKFFRDKNFSEIRKLKVCGFSAGTVCWLLSEKQKFELRLFRRMNTAAKKRR